MGPSFLTTIPPSLNSQGVRPLATPTTGFWAKRFFQNRQASNPVVLGRGDRVQAAKKIRTKTSLTNTLQTVRAFDFVFRLRCGHLEPPSRDRNTNPLSWICALSFQIEKSNSFSPIRFRNLNDGRNIPAKLRRIRLFSLPFHRPIHMMTTWLTRRSQSIISVVNTWSMASCHTQFFARKKSPVATRSDSLSHESTTSTAIVF